MAQSHDEPVAFKDCVELRNLCSRSRKSDIRWAIGIVLTVMSIMVLPLGATAYQLSIFVREKNAQQDQQILSLQASEALLRDDLRRINEKLDLLLQGQAGRRP